MNQHEALTHLDKLFSANGLEGLQKFAADKRVKWATVYAWHRRKSVPEWRLDLFTRKPVKKGSQQGAAA